MEGQVSVTRYTYAGLAMVTMATLMYEILLTRIFSITIWYHYAFLVISLALFGLTIGALIVYLRPHVFTLQRAKDHLALSSLGFAVSLVVTFLIHLGIPVEIDPSPGGLASLALTYLVVSVPFVFSGICVCIALTRFPDRVSRLYTADLIGAATGCLAVVFVLDLTDGPTAVIASGLLAALGALCFATDASRRRLLFGSLACVLLLAAATAVQGILSAEGRPPLRLTWSKQGQARGALLYEKWNSFSRITVNGVLELRTPPAGWGLSPFCRQKAPVRQLWLFIDAAAGTVITAYDGDTRKIEHLKCDVTNLAHYLRQDAEVLVIGAGGGRDVLSALTFGQRSVVAVELNENILETVNGRFGQFAGHLDQDPRVTFVNDEARSWLARQTDRFDIVQHGLT